MVRASWGSPCEFQRAFVDTVTGNTTCVWEAPSQEDMEAMFGHAGVEFAAMDVVDEFTSVDA